jgi:hypothetical protein
MFLERSRRLPLASCYRDCHAKETGGREGMIFFRMEAATKVLSLDVNGASAARGEYFIISSDSRAYDHKGEEEEKACCYFG